MKKPTGNEQTEWWIKREVKKILTATEWSFWMPAADVYGRNGISDFICVKKPKLFMVIETKYDDMVTTPQFVFLTAIHDAGHYALLVDETNIGELRALLANLSSNAIYRFMKWQTYNPIMDIRINKT
jgi:hypothetical protein